MPWIAGWWVIFPVFWIALGLVIVFGVCRPRWGWRQGWGGWYGPPDGHGGGAPATVNLEAILRERLARGDIDQVEFDRLRDLLLR